MLCGDFNASITCDPRHYQDRAFRAFCSEMELIQPESYQDGCTFHHANGSSSQIDYFLIERKYSDIISKVWLPEDSSSNTSDHTALLANFNIKKAHFHQNMKEKDQAKDTILPNPRWDKADIPTYQGLIKQRISFLPDQVRGCVDKLLSPPVVPHSIYSPRVCSYSSSYTEDQGMQKTCLVVSNHSQSC